MRTLHRRPWPVVRARWRPSPHALTLVACWLAGAVPLHAQGARGERGAGERAVESGTRVAVSVAGGVRQSSFGAPMDRFEGTVRSVARDTLYMTLPNVVGVMAIPRAAIRGMEVSLGPSRREGALRAGALTALTLAFSMWVEHQDPETRHFRAAWQAVAVGGAVGFAGGAWIGSRFPYERWRAAGFPE